MSEKIVSLDQREAVVSCKRDGNVWDVTEGERIDRIEVVSIRDGEAVVVLNGRREVVPFLADRDEIQFVLRGETYCAEVSSATGRRSRQRHRDHSLSAPMPGVVLQVLVRLGDQVTRGDTLIIMEAMKMEHRLTAPEDGSIDAVLCSEGMMVQPGVDLISIKPREQG